MIIEGFDHTEYAHQCHAASLALVKSGLLGEPARVARGSCPGVGGQHSWVVLGDNCYDPKARVIDPTLWSYVEEVEDIWEGKANKMPHRPHGTGSIWQWGRPDVGIDEPITLEVESGLAQQFLSLLGPLDRRGWAQLAHAPVEGWPSKEIVTAMYHHPKLAALVPIDIIGMLTDINPEGLYF